MFRFAHPEYFYLLLVLPVIYLVYLYGIFRRRRNLKKYGDIKLLESLMPDISRYKPHVKFYFQLFALFVLVFVIAGPQFGSKLESVKKQGVEIMIALDISNSMLAQDVQPSRLQKAKRLSFKKLSEDKDIRLLSEKQTTIISTKIKLKLSAVMTIIKNPFLLLRTLLWHFLLKKIMAKMLLRSARPIVMNIVPG